MDRTLTYPGALPQDTDILQPQRNIMEAIGFALQATFGVNTVVDGLTCTQTSPASMSVVVAPGSIIQNSVVDQNAYGSLAADTTDALVKMGINLTSTTLGPFTPPGTAGQSQNFLIEAAMSETDSGAVVLPYYDASHPSTPYAGPNNTATSQNTKRTQTVNLQIVAGTAATTGSQTTPAPSTGFVGLWIITIANGQSSITNSNITLYPSAPFVNGNGLTPTRGIQAGRLLNVQGFAVHGTYTYTPTPGTNSILVDVFGAGGGSGGTTTCTSSQASVTGGGGAGAHGRTKLTSGFLNGVTVTVGTGGAASSASAGNGGNGGTSSFGSFVTAPGGQGSTGQSASNTFVVTGGGTGGALASGGNFLNTQGSHGGYGFSNGLLGTSGAGGDNALGGGGEPVSATNVGGYAVTPGTGAGGSYTGPSGSAVAGAGGADGAVYVYEYS
jgi:hypothetical protein